MPRLRKVSEKQTREKKRVQKRKARKSVKETGDEKEGLNSPKKAENGLNFPKKAENGLNFPKKSENGLNFPKKSENGLNFPKKSEIAEDDMPIPAKHFTDSVAKFCTDSDAITFSESSLSFAKWFPNECLNVCCDFDEAFAGTYPNDVAKRLCPTDTELSLNDKAIIQNTDIEVLDTGPEIEETSDHGSCSERLLENVNIENSLATQSSALLWNANQIIFGSFHQNDRRFHDQSRGFQCTCNALCMFVCDEIPNSFELDKILYAGDALYNTTVNSLKAQNKFIQSLLSLEEIPDTLEIETGQVFIEKQPIDCGFLVNTFEDSALPSLHHALETAFIKSTSVLLIIGAVCSAVGKRNESYLFFDSHSHGEDGLSSYDGTSILMMFSSLEDLIAYLYAFYESMRIDMTMQFDLLPISVRKNEPSGSQKKQPENLLEAYFHDQTLRQQKKSVITNYSELNLNVQKKKESERVL